MVVEYSAAQHGGLEPVPTDQYPIPATPCPPVQAVVHQYDAPELALPANKAEDAPEPFVVVTEVPARTKNGLRSKKMLIIGIIILLVVTVGLGVGLGVALGRKNTDSSPSSAAAQTTLVTASAQITSRTSTSSSSAVSSTGSVVSLPLPSSTSGATGRDVYLNDQLITTHVSSWFYTGQTEAQVNQLCTQNNARITQIRVDNGTVPTFTVLMIQNTGIYNSTWWWYSGPNSYSQGNDRRIISVDPYYDASGTLQFAVVQVPNTGTQDRAWWWYYGQTTSSITNLLSQYSARLVSLRGYKYNGAVVYVILMAENVDQDYIYSEWQTGITIDAITSKASSGRRLLSLAPNPSGNWDAVFVTDTGDKWSWYYNLPFSDIGTTAIPNNLRLVDISPYVANGQTLFAMVETDNSQ